MILPRIEKAMKISTALFIGVLAIAAALPLDAYAAAVYQQPDHSILGSYNWPAGYSGSNFTLFSYVAPSSGMSSTTWLYMRTGGASNVGNCNEGGIHISVNGSVVSSASPRNDGISGSGGGGCSSFGVGFVQNTG